MNTSFIHLEGTIINTNEIAYVRIANVSKKNLKRECYQIKILLKSSKETITYSYLDKEKRDQSYNQLVYRLGERLNNE